MNESMPLVDIITPFKNASKFIADYVHSLKSQTFVNWRSILVNDASTDNSLILLRELTSFDPRFLILDLSPVQHPPGPAYPRNYALEISDAPYIAFHDIDDIWHPNKLEYQLQFHSELSLDISVTAYAKFKNNKETSPLTTVQPPHALSPSRLKYSNPIPMLTVIISRSSLTSYFPILKHEDYALWLRLFGKRSFRYGCLPYILSFYRVHSSNLTRNMLLMPLWTLKVYIGAGYSLLSAIIMITGYLAIHLSSLLSATFFVGRLNYSTSDLLVRPPLHLKPDV